MRTRPWNAAELEIIEEERQRWFEVSRSTAPTCVATIQKAWAALYRRSGRKPVFCWVVPSPLAAHVAMHWWSQHSLGQSLAALKQSLGPPSLKQPLEEALGRSLERLGWPPEQPLWRQLGPPSLRRPLEESVGSLLRQPPEHPLGPLLGWALEESLRQSLGQPLGQELRQELSQSLRQPLEETLGPLLEPLLGQSLRQPLEEPLEKALKERLGRSLGRPLGKELKERLKKTIGASLLDSLQSLWSWQSAARPSLVELRIALRESLRSVANIRYRPTWYWGAHDAYWVGWFRCAQRLGVTYTTQQEERLAEYEQVVRNALWAWPFENGVVVSARPTTYRMEEHQGPDWRLHAEDGPAVEFADGFQVHAWHGIVVPAQVIEAPETITAEQLIEEPNAEVARAMMEHLGYKRVVTLLGAVEIQADDYGTLYTAVVSGDPVKICRVVNGTPEPDGSYKEYWLPAPPNIETARQFVGWSYPALAALGIPPEDYTPQWRT